MRITPADAAVARLSRKQHGAWSRRQALGAGCSAKMISSRVASGEWIRLDNGVYAHLAAPATWERSLLAAVLAEHWAVVSHRSAAALHQLAGFRPGRPEITIRPGANARGRLALAHRGVDVRTTTVRGIPVVTVPQTFVDLAQVSGAARLQRALSERAEHDPRVLEAVRERYCLLAPRGGRNLRRLRAVLERFGSGELPERSALEAVLADVLECRGVPAVEWEAPFPGRASGPQRVDALVREWALVIEADGRAWHTRLEDFERDRRRDAEAAAAGYQTLRFTWHQLRVETSWVRRIVRQTGALRVPSQVGGTSAPRQAPGAPNLAAA